MEPSADKVSALREYVFDYIAGVLWLASFVVFVVTPTTVRITAAALNDIALKMPAVKVPEFAVGFLLATAGVALPYSISVAIKPLALSVMGWLQSGHRRLKHWRSRGKTDGKPTLDDLATERIRRTLDWRSGTMSREVRVAFVEARNPLAMATVKAVRDEVFFRATCVIPTSLLVSAVTYRINSLLVVPVAAFVVALVMGSWLANTTFDSWMLTVNTSVLLSPQVAEVEQARSSVNTEAQIVIRDTSPQQESTA
jgi:hypothetical protein